MKILTTLILTLFTVSLSIGQTFPSSRAELDSVYAANIKMSKLYGVYIPKDTDDAIDRLNKMTPPDAIEKFKNAPDEIEVSRKLKMGIGRWMILNWNFEEGSRLSHYLKQQGLLHPEDMSQYLMRVYYRRLNNLPDNSEAIIEELSIARKETVRKK
jgi:hypothetical protein